MNLTLDLFSEQEVLLDRQQLEAEALVLRAATERSRALREDLVFPAHDGALQLHPEILAIPPALNHHMYAFIAQAKCYGHTDPALSNSWVDGAGRSRYDEREVARFANEVICGIRSDRPTMTPARWGEATAKVRERGAS